jgi:hypothetical protein
LKEKEKAGSKVANKSYVYVLPLCGTRDTDFKYCNGCFVGDSTYPEITDKVLLLYNTEYSLYEYQDEWLQNLNLFNHKYVVDSTHNMYVYNLPMGYEHNYYAFIDGKYSTMDEVYKKHIVKFHSSHKQLDRIKQVLYKADRLYREWEDYLKVTIPRDQEIGSIPDVEKEVFSLQMIQEDKREWL